MAKKPQKIKLKELILSNIPNFLTMSRFLLTFVVIYRIFMSADIRLTILIFALAAFTDFLDGKLARKYNWTSEFGRQADMVADRFLWVGTAIAFLIDFGLQDLLTWKEGLALLLIMTRELLCAPFALIAFFFGNVTPQARYVAKVTTFIQGFALPALMLSVYYPFFNYILWPTAIACAVTGFYSALYYMNDIKKK